MSAVRIGVRRLAHGRDMPLPAYETEGAAGMDLRAATDSEVSIAPGQRALIATGLIIALPEGHEAQIRPRSGLALKHGIMVVNSPAPLMRTTAARSACFCSTRATRFFGRPRHADRSRWSLRPSPGANGSKAN